ncbi:MAG: aspartate kinase, partial [Candidatus Methanomethylophilaceae archaeon]|nr:aspartate kinase [Candidatus Methanomethylophilaceae archaeon]
MITVKKFGGTSVGSAEALKRAAKIIMSGEGQTVVVVSAMSGITNFLVGAAEDKNASEADVFSKFEARHMEVAKELLKAGELKAFKKDFDSRMEGFKAVYAARNSSTDPYYKDNL